MRKSAIGGQGVMDGVMMRSKDVGALAVRKSSGEIETKTWPIKKRNAKILNLPIIRGVVSFIDVLFVGVGVLSDAAKMAGYDEEEYGPNKFEKFVAKKTGKSAEDVMMSFAVVIAIAISVGLFFMLPTFLTGLIHKAINSTILKNLADGGIRLLIFLLYMFAVSFIPDIKKVFRYHGAEHKTIACYEHEEELTATNIRKHSRFHPRCGTNYLLIVMVVAMVVYSFFGWGQSIFLRMGLRLLMLPVVAGVSYEILRFLGRSDGLFARIVRWPGLQLQRMTTAEPDDDMINVAILAFELALSEKNEEEITRQKEHFRIPGTVPQETSDEPA